MFFVVNHLKAKSISSKPFIRGTHLSKFESAMNEYGCINSDHYSTKARSKPLISTDSIINKVYDIAHSNGNQISFSRFLIVKINDQETVFDKILKSETTWLNDYISDEAKRIEIVRTIKSAITISVELPNPAQHKQVYFPLSDKKESYHVICPLFSTTFCQLLFHKTKELFYSQKMLINAKRNNLYIKEILLEYKNTAILIMGGKKPHNISPLNSNRYGQVILLPNHPPEWKTQLKPPLKVRSIFNRELDHQAHTHFEELRNLLVAIKMNELGLNLQRKQHIARLVNDIAGTVFDYVALIQGLKQFVGWSNESQLPYHQQIWLDPYRSDEEIQNNLANTDWQVNIAHDFSRWINQGIKHPKLTLGVEAENHWRKLFIPLLREFNAIAETTLDDFATVEGKHHE